MSEVKHDYNAVLDDLTSILDDDGKPLNEYQWKSDFFNANYETIIHALKLAAVVTGEPTEGMIDALSENLDHFAEIGTEESGDGTVYKNVPVSCINIDSLENAIKAMIAQAEKEIG